MIESITQYAKERALSFQDAAQTFFQIIVLKNLSLPKARLIGGTALVLGHGNPRFSEDIDLAGIQDPFTLKANLNKAVTELSGWLQGRVTLLPPKKGGRTWRLSWSRNPAETIRMHVDCQPYAAQTVHPVVLSFPSLSSFVFETESLEEIMADKIIALASRNYLGGRDLFDLWFHWLRSEEAPVRSEEVLKLLQKKLTERSLTQALLARELRQRLGAPLNRARDEWRRYLPPSFHKESVWQEILASARQLLEYFP